ncbi:V-type proton ATPase subunit F-like [Hermetia illucens]|uniref:V-type proton ATPase subunit F-like n=1 Tax=Hermetia illucens TaxID=343691 RepID=UPI0018CC6A1B|nr:V-type proton ATPase subunit F-like [Hermetia illucens]
MSEADYDQIVLSEAGGLNIDIRRNLYTDGYLIGLIAEEDACVGFLLAGIGQCRKIGDENFFPVNEKTNTKDILDFFEKLRHRKDIAIILIESHIARKIQVHTVDIKSTYYKNSLPIMLEIPSKGMPFKVEEDKFVARAMALAGDTS